MTNSLCTNLGCVLETRLKISECSVREQIAVGMTMGFSLTKLRPAMEFHYNIKYRKTTIMS